MINLRDSILDPLKIYQGDHPYGITGENMGIHSQITIIFFHGFILQLNKRTANRFLKTMLFFKLMK